MQRSPLLLSTLTTVLNTSIDGIAILDHNGNIKYVNESLARRYGYLSPSELVEKPMDTLCDKDEATRVRKAAWPAMKQCGTWIGEVAVIRRDGTRARSEVRMSLAESEEIVCTFHDSTELQRSEDLKHTASLLKATLESTADGILVIGFDGKIASYNQRFLNMWRIPGYLMHLNDDQKVLCFVLDQLKDPQAFLQRVSQLYANVEEESLDVLEFKDGRIFERYSLPQYVDGLPVGRVWSFRDVTERVELLKRERSARAQAEAAQRRSAFLAEAATILDASLDYERTLETVAHLIVPKLADWCAIDIVEQDGSLRRVAAASLFSCPLKNKDLVTYRDRAIALNATAICADSRCLAVLLKARGKTLGIVTYGFKTMQRVYDPADIQFGEALAQRAALAIDNARLYLEAQDNIRARHEFISIASHELKTPITSLQGYIQLLQKILNRKNEPIAVETLSSMARGAEQQCRRLVKFVENLLDISRISADKLSLEIEQLNLCDVARDVVGRFRQTFQDEGYQVTFHCPKSISGFWDRIRLDQVLTNLISNAIKYGGKRPIEITIEPLDGGVRIQVTDHGIGISPENQARIFKSFERAVSGRKYGGTGLGLWIVRQIVEAHGGHIRVTSEPGSGSTFEVLLPQNTRHQLKSVS